MKDGSPTTLTPMGIQPDVPAGPGAESPCGSSEPPTLVSLEGIGFRYPGTQAQILEDLSLKIGVGEVVAVVGPSGSGKSTLLSVLSGLMEASSGEIHWDESLIDAGRHRLSMLFQTDTLLPWLTVEKNVALHYRLIGERQALDSQRERIRHLIAVAGLSGTEHVFPYRLSGGMKRRAAFLASVVPNPQLLLLDEPFASVDEPTRVSIHNDIHKIIKDYRISVVLVTHDLAEAVSLSDRVVILSKSPARVVYTEAIPFGEHRDMLNLRDDPMFLEVYGRLWNKLGEQVAAES